MLVSVLKMLTEQNYSRTAVIFRGANLRIVSQGFTEFCGNLECGSFEDTRISRLASAIPTFYDHFPKPCSWVWPTGFSRTGWRWCHSNLICRRGWRRRELSPGKNACISVFTCERAISYHSMNTTVMRGQRRSENNMRFGPSGYSSSHRRLLFQRKLSSGFRGFSLGLPVIRTQRQRVRIC